jgi:hypothetical protein
MAARIEHWVIDDAKPDGTNQGLQILVFEVVSVETLLRGQTHQNVTLLHL